MNLYTFLFYPDLRKTTVGNMLVFRFVEMFNLCFYRFGNGSLLVVIELHRLLQRI